MTFLWLKVGHIVSFTAWFAGIFYIWRLFVYHAETESADVRATLEVMERRLIQAIMRPAAVATLTFGFWMLVGNWTVYAGQLWIWLKLGLVFLVLVNHGMAEHYRLQLMRGVTYKQSTLSTLKRDAHRAVDRDSDSGCDQASAIPVTYRRRLRRCSKRSIASFFFLDRRRYSREPWWDGLISRRLLSFVIASAYSRRL